MLSKLSARELEVLRELMDAAGVTKAAAARLGISARTVEFHRSNILRKTGAKSLVELVAVALRQPSSRKGALPAEVIDLVRLYRIDLMSPALDEAERIKRLALIEETLSKFGGDR
ncbi:MAG: LuxR C-terminal-related transcriptional regulator [Bauldia sp.]